MKNKEKKTGPKKSVGLRPNVYSRVRSHYCSTRELLPAASPPWACPLLIIQPGNTGLPPHSHIDAELSDGHPIDIEIIRTQNPQRLSIHRFMPSSHWNYRSAPLLPAIVLTLKTHTHSQYFQRRTLHSLQSNH